MSSKGLKVGVIGSGTMGRGIAQVAATAGCEVLVFDNDAAASKKSEVSLDAILDRLVEKERIDKAEKERIQKGITYVQHLKDLSNCELIIEAIIESAEIKRAVFAKLEDLVSKETILASNTSSLSITSLGAALDTPERFIGIHFFNPVPLMKLVEIIPAIQTDSKIVTKTKNIIKSWNKTTVLAKDTPGFIVNKVARPFYGESLRILEEGIADHATIDWAMKELGGFRMGPFELMDFIGNDINFTVTQTVFKAFFYDSRYRPSLTQKSYAEAGYLGRKSGRGYYDYSEDAKKPRATKDEKLGQQIVDRVLAMLINEAADTLHMGIASAGDIDLAMTKGVNYPKGLLTWADEIGVKKCVDRMDALFNEYHEERYRCSSLLRQLVREKKTFADL